MPNYKKYNHKKQKPKKEKIDYEARILNIVKGILKYKLTLRQAEIVYSLSRSTIHHDIHKRINKESSLYKEVCRYLHKNFKFKHINGGNASKLRRKGVNINETN